MKKIYSAFFRELRNLYTFEEIAQNFGLPLSYEQDYEISNNSEIDDDKYKKNKESLKSVLEKLCSKSICKDGKAKELRIDDINNGDDEAIEIISSETAEDDTKKLYSFTFVGIVSYENFIFYIYPKYIQTDNREDLKPLFARSNQSIEEYESSLIEYRTKFLTPVDQHFKTLMRVINEFAKDNFVQPLTFINNPLKHIDPVSFMVFMLQQYYEHGLYYKEETVIETNGDGEIDWNRTINETQPVIQNNIPYYIELKTIQKQEASINFLRNLHMAILSECSQQLEEMGILKYIGIAPLYFEYRKVSSLGANDYLERVINNELRIQNANLQKIQLYNMLHYIKENDKSTHSKTISIYGTKKFDPIWEKVQKALFNDLYDNDKHFYYTDLNGCEKITLDKIERALKEKSNKLNLSKIENSDKETIQYFMGITSMRTWKDREPKKLNGGYRLKPDIVTIINNKLLILDAKYYCVQETENENKEIDISEIPGATDISKQFEYERLFSNGLDKYNLKLDITNMFIMPEILTCDDLSKDNEILKKDFLADYDYLRKSFNMGNDRVIRIISLNPDICYKMFLEKKSFFDKNYISTVENIINDPEYNPSYVKIIVCFGEDNKGDFSINSENYIYNYTQCSKIIYVDGDYKNLKIDKINEVHDLNEVSENGKGDFYRFTVFCSEKTNENHCIEKDILEKSLKNYEINNYIFNEYKICLLERKYFEKN